MSVLSELTCYKCKQPFGLPHDVQAMLRRSHQTFYCPWGHPQIYIEGESEETKLHRERDRLKQDAARLHDSIREYREWAQREQRRSSALKGVATRLKNRAAKGVCPCCNRSFENLRRHMSTKHPGVAVLDVEKLTA